MGKWMAGDCAWSGTSGRAVEIPMEEYRFAQEVTKCDQIHFWDKELDQRLIGIGGCDETIYSLKEKEGMLRVVSPKRKYCRSSLLLLS